MEFWFSEFHTPDVKHSIRVNKQLYSKQSDYQRIDIFETPEFGRVLTLDGNVMLTERDEFIYDEMIVHVPMAVHKEAKDILVIGAGDGGVVRELTRYDRVERIDLVEMDPQVVEACRAYLPGNACRMDDRRVHIYFENALKYIRRCEEEYDLIIVDSSDPFGPSEGLFTREFYGSCFNALKEDGIMVNQQGSPFYAEDASAMQRSHKRIASTFPISRVYQAHIPTFAAGYWLFGFASKKYHPIDDLDAACLEGAEHAHPLLHHPAARRGILPAGFSSRRCCGKWRNTDATPTLRPFIGCDSSYRAASIVLYGAPYDSTTSYRPGARFGPAAIRHESYGPGDLQPLPERRPDRLDVFRQRRSGAVLSAPASCALADIEARAAEIFARRQVPAAAGRRASGHPGRGAGCGEEIPGPAHRPLLTPTPTCGTTIWGAKLSHACVLRRCHELVATAASISSASAAATAPSSSLLPSTPRCTSFDFHRPLPSSPRSCATARCRFT